MNGELFNYEDLEVRARRYLEEVRRQAKMILENAAQEADTERKRLLEEMEIRRRNAEEKGYRDGYDTGYEEGLRVSGQEIEKQIQAGVTLQLKPAAEALSRITDALEESRNEWKARWEKNALRLVCLIAEHVIRREMQKTPEIEREWIREALELTSGGDISLHMSPEDIPILRPTLEPVIKRMRNLGNVEFHADETFPGGDCELHTHFGKIDMRVEAQMRRILDELS